MNVLAEQIANNPYIVITGWLATIIALLLAIIVPIIQAKKTELSFLSRTNLIVADNLSKIEDLEIRFKGNIVKALSITTFEIRNTGNVTIKKEDVYEGHEIKIHTKDDRNEVLFASVVSETSDTNKSQVSYDKNSITLDFGTLEKKEAVVINIYHSGDENTEFSVDGRIRDGKIKAYKENEFAAKGIALNIVFFLLGVGLLILIIIYILPALLSLMLLVVVSIIFSRALLGRN